jgi:hypothetical protein
MAIHPDYPDLKVKIIVEGKAPQEFRNDDEEDRPGKITR